MFKYTPIVATVPGRGSAHLVSFLPHGTYSSSSLVAAVAPRLDRAPTGQRGADNPAAHLRGLRLPAQNCPSSQPSQPHTGDRS